MAAQMVSRRRFLSTAGIAAMGAMAAKKGLAIPAQTGRRFRGPYGLELYSLRRQIHPGDSSTVKAALVYAKKVGYTEIEAPELYGLDASEFRDLLNEVGLPCTSLMCTYKDCQTGLDALIRNAHTLGARNLINVWIPHGVPFTLDVCRDAAKSYNQWGEKVRNAGLRFGHHTHGYEFQPYQGRPLFDTLLEQTNPEYVEIEMDIFWVVDAGQSPVDYMRRYPSRIRLLHLKDMKKGPPVENYTGSAPVEWDVPLGTGRIDIPAILREAEHIGVQGYYVEDESNESRQGIVKTLRYLKTVRI